MKQSRIFSATEARQNFFKLLRIVEKGREAIIIKKDSNVRFKVTLVAKKKNKDKMEIVEEMTKIGLKTGPWEEIKKIIVAVHDINLNSSLEK